jgi:hypothetical protein
VTNFFLTRNPKELREIKEDAKEAIDLGSFKAFIYPLTDNMKEDIILKKGQFLECIKQKFSYISNWW